MLLLYIKPQPLDNSYNMKNHKKGSATIIILIIIVIAVAICGYVLMNKNQPQEKVETTTEASSVSQADLVVIKSIFDKTVAASPEAENLYQDIVYSAYVPSTVSGAQGIAVYSKTKKPFSIAANDKNPQLIKIYFTLLNKTSSGIEIVNRYDYMTSIDKYNQSSVRLEKAQSGNNIYFVLTDATNKEIERIPLYSCGQETGLSESCPK
jgi:hypothetical protein